MEYEVIKDMPSARDVLQRYNNGEPTFCDIETDGLYGYTRLIQIHQREDKVFILDMDHLDLKEVKGLLGLLWTVWWNASYDLGTLNMITSKVDDLFYLVKTAYPQFMEFGLGKVTEKFTRLGLLDRNLYANLDKSTLQKRGFIRNARLSLAQLKYSAIDVYVLGLIWDYKKVQLIRDNLAYKVDMLSLNYAIQYQQNGILIDPTLRAEFMAKDGKLVDEYMRLLPPGLNPNSSPQVRAFLGTEKANRETFTRLALDKNHPMSKFGNIFIELKKAMKRKKYLEDLPFSRVYTKFNVAGASTGRTTAKGGDLKDGINSQQIPRMLQKIFASDTEDTAVVDIDYSTLELRLACAIYNEPEMYKQFMSGADLHTETAVMSTGKKLHPDGLTGSVYDDKKKINTTPYVSFADREKAKAVNFGFVFGMSAKTYVDFAFLNYGIEVTYDEALKIREKYFNKYQGMAKYHKYVWDNYKNPTFTYRTALGRRVKPKLGTDAINGPVQGSGAEVTKLAIHYLIKEHPEALKYIFNVVHDAIYLRVPKADKEMWTKRLKTAMLKGWTEVSKSSLFHFKDIPMPMG